MQVTMGLQRECREQESVKDGEKDGRSTTRFRRVNADLVFLDTIKGSLRDTKPKRCAIPPILHGMCMHSNVDVLVGVLMAQASSK